MAHLTDHIRAGELFSAYIDQRVTADEQAFVERHVATCAACRAQLQATRSMVAALKAMPVVKAPRSFVLPKSMAVQPKPSIFSWYLALRLATVMAAVAFVLVFAGDLLTVRPNGGGNVVMSVAAPTAAMPAAEAPAAAPTAAPQAKSAAADQQPPSAVPAPAGAAPMVGAAASAQPTATMEATDAARAAALSAQATPTETQSAYAMTDTVETTATAALTMAVEAPAPAVTTAVPPTIDPLRLASIVLGGLVVVLGTATLIIRRGV